MRTGKFQGRGYEGQKGCSNFLSLSFNCLFFSFNSYLKLSQKQETHQHLLTILDFFKLLTLIYFSIMRHCDLQSSFQPRDTFLKGILISSHIHKIRLRWTTDREPYLLNTFPEQAKQFLSHSLNKHLLPSTQHVPDMGMQQERTYFVM